MKPSKEKKDGVMFHIAEYETDGRVYRKWNFEKIANGDDTRCSRTENLQPIEIMPAELLKKLQNIDKQNETPIQQTRKAKKNYGSHKEDLMVDLETEVTFQSAKKPTKTSGRANSPLARRLKQQRVEAEEAKEMQEDDKRRKKKEAACLVVATTPKSSNGNGNCQEMKRAVEELNRKFDALMNKVDDLAVQVNKKNKMQ